MRSTNTMTIWAGYHETAVGKTIGFRLSHLGLTFQSGQSWFGKSVGEAPLFCRVLKTGHAALPIMRNEISIHGILLRWLFPFWRNSFSMVKMVKFIMAKSTATMG